MGKNPRNYRMAFSEETFQSTSLRNVSLCHIPSLRNWSLSWQGSSQFRHFLDDATSL